jgi:hypothetical protein
VLSFHKAVPIQIKKVACHRGARVDADQVAEAVTVTDVAAGVWLRLSREASIDK